VSTDAKTLRSDARRNRERLVATARELFASEGVDVPVEEIVHRAGLGMGTLYRHFPTKEELIDAVLEEAFAELVELAEHAAEEDDAWAGLTGFLEEALARHAGNHGLKDMVATSEHGRQRVQALRERIRPALARMVERAQAQGALRPDVTTEDVPLVFWTAGRVIERTESVAPEQWRRFLGLVLDGLRASAATPLPVGPMTPAELDRAAGRREA
jgi:AcrR family transcriptional regulator